MAKKSEGNPWKMRTSCQFLRSSLTVALPRLATVLEIDFEFHHF